MGHTNRWELMNFPPAAHTTATATPAPAPYVDPSCYIPGRCIMKKYEIDPTGVRPERRAAYTLWVGVNIPVRTFVSYIVVS